jgi:protein gp37
MSQTSIEWASAGLASGHTINPFRARDKKTGKNCHWCCKISAGCKFCYSSASQPRWGGHEFIQINRSKVDLWLDYSKLEEVLRRRTPTGYFWCDMADMFLEDYPDEWIDQCFAVMALTPRHRHMVLTKRAERMRRYFEVIEMGGHDGASDSPYPRVVHCIRDIPDRFKSVERDNLILPRWPLSNVWLGVSAEDQKTADERIPLLLQTPAAVRFVSYEPALGPVSFRWAKWVPRVKPGQTENHLDGLKGIDWIICGGESGPHARPFDIAWARDTIEQCKAAGVPVFVKQLGAKPVTKLAELRAAGGALRLGQHTDVVKSLPVEDRSVPIKLKDRKGGDMEEWPSDLRIRQFPKPYREAAVTGKTAAK